MTRACPLYANAPSPKCAASSPHKTLGGGVAKSYRPSSPGKSFKTYVKARSTSQCLKILKKLLPNAKHRKTSTELELVEETIAYISHLESLLQPQPSSPGPEQQLSYEQDQPTAVASATRMLEDMSF